MLHRVYFLLDVECVLEKKPHRHGRWSFDVAEYYPDIGVCGQDSLCIYKNNYKTEDGMCITFETYSLMVLGNFFCTT